MVGRANFVLTALRQPSAGEDFRTLVARNGRLLAEIVPGHVHQRKALELLTRLRRERPDLPLTILSGDPRALSGPLKELAMQGEIEYRGNLSPRDKVLLMPSNALYIGDGLNDIPAMARAAVCLRVGTRARGYSAVDLELPRPDLTRLPVLLGLSQHFVKVLKQTALLAASYNLIAWSLAAAGWFTPLGAVGAMLTSLCLMTLSCLRPLGPRSAPL